MEHQINLLNIIEEAKWVVLLFDQANTNDAILRLGSRGYKVTQAIEDLRKSLKDSGIDPYSVQGGVWEVGSR